MATSHHEYTDVHRPDHTPHTMCCSRKDIIELVQARRMWQRSYGRSALVRFMPRIRGGLLIRQGYVLVGNIYLVSTEHLTIQQDAPQSAPVLVCVCVCVCVTCMCNCVC